MKPMTSYPSRKHNPPHPQPCCMCGIVFTPKNKNHAAACCPSPVCRKKQRLDYGAKKRAAYKAGMLPDPTKAWKKRTQDDKKSEGALNSMMARAEHILSVRPMGYVLTCEFCGRLLRGEPKKCLVCG